MSIKGKRLDLLLEEKGLFVSRQVAKTAIMDGGVLVNGVKVTKPGTLIKDGANIQIKNEWLPQKYVSRGGLKLEKALNEFALEVKGKNCLDVGASTGGFTDCLLQAGADFVYAVDVGHGQMVWSLRTDARVKVLEKTNARSINREILKGTDELFRQPIFAVIDVSFISLNKILPAIKDCLPADCAEIVALVKPQFEVGKENVGKGGVVRSPDLHLQVLKTIVAEASELGFIAHALTFSPLKGPQGNIEFLLLLRTTAAASPVDQQRIEDVVSAAGAAAF